MAKIEDICQAYKAAGLYTHVYVSCGFLYEDRNLFEFSILPEDRSVFDLASLTKALVTTPLVLWRCLKAAKDPRALKISELFGDISLDEVGAGSHNLSVADYLRHETGLPAWRNLYTECQHQRQSLRDVLMRSTSKSGSADLYSDVGFITLGQLLERSSNQNILDEWKFLCELFEIPSAKKFGSGPSFDLHNAISTGYCPVRQRELLGEVHDENCWALGGMAGHAGLFGGGAAVSSYLRQLWQSSVGRVVFEKNFCEAATPGDSLLGWRKGKDASANAFAEGRGCGHMGFTGTAFWVDPLTRSYCVVLTNRVISGRVSPAMKAFRSQVLSSLWYKIKGSF